jgi:3-phosphoshikimate 1-carboxyvinyltransferase
VATEVVAPARSLRGVVSVPGDKSISHRYAILGALAEGRTQICGFSPAADCRSTLECLRRLGLRVESSAGIVTVHGAGLRGLRAPRGKLDAGNSGTTMRLLAGVLAGQSFTSTLTGDQSLIRRPMRRVIEPLSRMGARIEARDGEYPPLKIRGAPLQPVDCALPVASAQVKSAILLAALYAPGPSRVTEPARTRDHTELALREFGADVAAAAGSIRISPPARLQPLSLSVPGDLSSAVYFLAAALILPDSELLITGSGLNPTRSAVLDVLTEMGAALRVSNLSEAHGELVGDIEARSTRLSGGAVGPARVPLLIDELPMLAALAPYTEKGIEIRGAAELRVKESDRIAALAENLRRMGAQVEEFDDGLRVAGREAGALRGAEIDPRGDHRIAMALSVAALAARGESRIRDAGCVGVSYPGFFTTLEALAEK